MSLRLRLLNIALRWIVKPALSHFPDPQTARAHLERSGRLVRPFLTKARITQDEVQGPGGPIPIEWVSREETDRRSIVIYVHGGAFIMGSPRTHRSMTSMLARESGWRVMVPDYRLAPEYPCPAGVEDVLACYTALIAQGYDPKRIALAGESAGGGIALASLGLIEAKGFPMPACVMVGSPSTDMAFKGESFRTNAKRDVMLPVERAQETAGYYIGNSLSADDPRASPINMVLKNPPPVYISVGKQEILLDDARGMARALEEQGGIVKLVEGHNWPHAFIAFSRAVPEALDLLRDMVRFLNEHSR